MLELAFGLPAIVATNKGTLLAFAQGLLERRGDAGNIDLLKRTSAEVPQSLGHPFN